VTSSTVGPRGPDNTPSPITDPEDKKDSVTDAAQEAIRSSQSESFQSHRVRKNIPHISKKQAGKVRSILKTTYGINVRGSTIEEIITRIKNSGEQKFIEEKLASDWSGSWSREKKIAAQIIRAAALLRDGESVSIDDAYGRAGGRLAAYRSDKVSRMWKFFTLGEGYGLIFYVLLLPITLPVTLGIELGYRIWQHRQVKRWEGVDSQVKNVDIVSRTAFLQQRLNDPRKKFLFFDWKPFNFLQTGPDDLTKWCDECLEFLDGVKKELPNALVVPVPREEYGHVHRGALTTYIESDYPIEHIEEIVNENYTKLIQIRDFLAPPAEQQLQLDWYSRDWKYIRKRLQEGDFHSLQQSVEQEKARLEGGLLLAPILDKRSSVPVKYSNFDLIIDKHKQYIEAAERALREYEGSERLDVFLRSDGPSFDRFIATLEDPSITVPKGCYRPLFNYSGECDPKLSWSPPFLCNVFSS